MGEAARLALWGGLLGAATLGRGESGLDAATVPLAREIYIVAQHESLSEVLYSHGIGHSGSAFRLYGRDGWLDLHRRLNSHLPDLASLPVGARVVLVLPESLAREGSGRLRAKIWADGRLYELKWFLHTVEAGETLSGILHRVGIGVNDSPFRLFGAERTLARVAAINGAALDDLDHLRRGQRIVIEVPVMDLAVVADRKPTEPVPTAQEAAHQPLNMIVTLPKDEIAKIPSEILGDKLTPDAIAGLTPEQQEKIPEPVREDKAWDYSLADALDPKVRGFFQGLKLGTAGAYVGVRYGLSLADRSDKLASKLMLYSVLAEIRGGALSGLRFYYDWVPTVRAKVDGDSLSLGWRRALLGWAFEFGPFGVVDKLHVTPKLGRYTVDARLHLGRNDAGESVVDDLRVKGGVSTGLEADVEETAFFYVARLWLARDLSSLGSTTERTETVSSTRAGADLFLKGAGFGSFGHKISLHYLLFAIYERVTLTGRYPDADHSFIDLEIPFAGAGLSLAW